MIEVIDREDVRTLVLNRPPVNALDDRLLEALAAELRRAPRDGARGLVLTGAGRLFSAGLDVRHVLSLSTDELLAFVRLFFGVLSVLAESPLPVVAAINGASPAGGAVLSLACDWRVMVRGEARIGVNEVRVGLFPGAMIHGLLQRVVGARHAASLLSGGLLLTPEDALAVGLVDALCEAGELTDVAGRWLRQHLDLPSAAFAATRALVRRDLHALLRSVDDEQLRALVTTWSTDEARAALAAATSRR